MDLIEQDWIERMSKVETDAEFRALIMELPDDLPSSTKKDDRESSITEQTPTSSHST